MIHWLLHITGADNVSGKWYGWWSGFGGNWAPNPYWFMAFALYLRHHNCEVKGCPYPGRIHPESGKHLCRVHRKRA